MYSLVHPMYLNERFFCVHLVRLFEASLVVRGPEGERFSGV